MTINFAVDRLYATGWLATDDRDLERLPNGLRYPTVAAVRREFAEAGLTLSIKSNLMFHCWRAAWESSMPDSLHGTVIGSCENEAAVYALAKLREQQAEFATVGIVMPAGVTRTVCVGGMSKVELLAELASKKIQLNQSGIALFENEKFTTSEIRSTVLTVQLSIADLGFANGATIHQIHTGVAELGFSSCPLELGPHLRLQYLNQPEGSLGGAPSQHCAPPGSITIASHQLSGDYEIPKGFYLRRIEGILWLRGYRSDPAHVFNARDQFVFCR